MGEGSAAPARLTVIDATELERGHAPGGRVVAQEGWAVVFNRGESSAVA